MLLSFKTKVNAITTCSKLIATAIYLAIYDNLNVETISSNCLDRITNSSFDFAAL